MSVALAVRNSVIVACEALLNDQSSVSQEDKVAFEKQQKLIQLWKSMSNQDQQKLTSSNATLRMLVRVDAMTESVLVASSEKSKSTTENLDHLKQHDHGGESDKKDNKKKTQQKLLKNKKQDKNMEQENVDNDDDDLQTKTSHQISNLVREARACSQFSILPRPGTSSFFSSSSSSTTTSSNKNEKVKSSQVAIRRERNEYPSSTQQQKKDEEEEKEEGDEQQQEEKSRLFSKHIPVVDGSSFLAISSTVAHLLSKSEKFKQLLKETLKEGSEQVFLSKEEREGEQEQTMIEVQRGVAYQLVHSVVDVILAIIRRLQCYSQCSLDLQKFVFEDNSEQQKKNNDNDNDNDDNFLSPLAVVSTSKTLKTPTTQQKSSTTQSTKAFRIIQQAMNTCKTKIEEKKHQEEIQQQKLQQEKTEMTQDRALLIFGNSTTTQNEKDSDSSSSSCSCEVCEQAMKCFDFSQMRTFPPTGNNANYNTANSSSAQIVRIDNNSNNDTSTNNNNNKNDNDQLRLFGMLNVSGVVTRAAIDSLH